MFALQENVAFMKKRNPAFIFGIFHDITDEIIAYERLEANNHFLNLIMENISDFLFVKDSDFKIVKANSAFLSAYPKKQRDKVIGSTTVEQYSDHEAVYFLAQDKIASDMFDSQTA